MSIFREYLSRVEGSESDDLPLVEDAPPGEAAEEWIKHRKAAFKKRYGKRWQSVLYGAAWKRFGK